jgi:hypothetical protein
MAGTDGDNNSVGEWRLLLDEIAFGQATTLKDAAREFLFHELGARNIEWRCLRLEYDGWAFPADYFWHRSSGITHTIGLDSTVTRSGPIFRETEPDEEGKPRYVLDPRQHVTARAVLVRLKHADAVRRLREVGSMPLQHDKLVADSKLRQKPGTKYKDDWPMVMATEVVRRAHRDPEMLKNITALGQHMRKFLEDELGSAPKDLGAIKEKLRFLLRHVR